MSRYEGNRNFLSASRWAGTKERRCPARGLVMPHNLRSLIKIGLFASLCLVLVNSIPSAAFDAQNVPTVHAISRTNNNGRSYKSWSLFLICNPGWMLRSGDEGIRDLFKAYSAFGRAIGPDNLALWFSDNSEKLPTLENTDIDRMSRYCVRFGLLPSQTPQVVTVTRYPDNAEVGAKVVANLNGDATNSARVLTDLTDELLKTGLSQTSLDENHWGTWVASSASAVMARAACYLNKVSFSITTGVVNVEIAHAVDKGC
jgi:hypothetical protein